MANKLKRAVIKEELVALTGDYRLAIVLNQMIYWSERVRDFDKFIEEEKKRILTFAQSEHDVQRAEALELSHGWIYKKAEELAEETMMNVSKTTMGKYLDTLVQNGWLEKRRNPRMPLDKTYQYRVNITKIQRDLLALGYNLDNYRIDLATLQQVVSESKNETPKSNYWTSESENLSRSQETGLEVEKMDSKSKNETAIPETTYTEITEAETTGRDYDNNHHHQTSSKEKNVVVVDEQSIQHSQNHIQYRFEGANLSKEQIARLIRICAQHGKDIDDVVEDTYYYFAKKQEPIDDLMGALVHGAKYGWEESQKVRVVPSLQFQDKKQKQEFTPYNWVEAE